MPVAAFGQDPDRAWRRATCVVLVLAAIVFAAICGDYGVTWDEGVQATYGELTLDYFATGGDDTRATTYSNLYFYGPLFETVAATVYRLSGGPKYEVRHALIGVTALLTVVAVWRFGRIVGSAAVAFYAVTALLMMPRFVGHAFNNSKDVPFACAFAWSMLAIARLLGPGGWGWRDAARCGAAIGLALSVRVGGLLLFGMLAAGLAFALRDASERRAWRREARGRLLRLVTIGVLGWAIMIAGWPWAHGGVLTRPFVAAAEMSSFTFSYTTLFAGELVPSDRLPRTYLPAYLGIATPLSVLALALVGLVVASRALLARRHGARHALALGWVLAPLAYVIAARPNVYDGLRHFLFVLPGIAVLAGLGASALLERAGRLRSAVAVALLAVLLVPLRDQVLLHPYQSSYFNALVGGTGRAWKHYDTDYWASSYREAMLWILDRADEDMDIVVACNENNRPCAETYLDPVRRPPGAPRVRLHCVWNGDETFPASARYYVGMLRFGKASAFFPTWPVVHRVGRRGAIFSVVKGNPARDGKAAPGDP